MKTVHLSRSTCSIWLGCCGLALLLGTQAGAAIVEGELETWHRVEIRFAGPVHTESDNQPNPFLDYRLQCALTAPSGRSYDVPGFFDADGGDGTTGGIWRCRFAPDEAGLWTYRASFRSGAEIAVSLDAQAGSPISFDNDAGSFRVQPSGKTGDDFRRADRGRLVNAGDHYLAFAGSGMRWIKGGPNIPENLLGYSGFDNTPNAGHSFSAHVADWRSGDPDWGSGNGRGLIGALNYIATTGGNSVYFLPMNIGGDGKDTFPTIAEQDKTHYDTSKLRQWETVFTHATSRGIFLHFLLAETETANEQYHDGGQLGPERKLFYRELVARFAHQPGLQWNLGEENDYGTTNRRAFAAYLKAIDPYDHPVTTHTRTNALESVYAPLLGNSDFDTTSFQVTTSGFQNGASVEAWRTRSAQSGVPWVISVDEPQRIDNDPNDTVNGYPKGRTAFLWPTYLSGGGGFEWYVRDDGGNHGFDQRIENFREMEDALRWTAHARAFMDELPFWLMTPRPDLASSSAGGKTFALARPGDSYALYHAQGGSLSLDLSADTGSFAFQWFDPENGNWFAGGTVQGGAQRSLGSPPFGGDAAALLVRTGGPDGADPVASFTATPLRGEAPLAVRFDAASSLDDGTIQSYGWTFGDGSAGSGLAPQHTYQNPGSYLVTLVVTDDEGRSGATTQTVVALDPPPMDLPPTGFQLMVSGSAHRVGAVPLAEQSLADNAYIFLTPGSGVAQARFSLDGVFRQTERFEPHDFAGGSVDRANPFDTNNLTDGLHRISVEITLVGGRVIFEETSFRIDNVGHPGELLFSTAATRSQPRALAGAQISHDTYVYLPAGTNIQFVRFFIDDPGRLGTAEKIERIAPYDLGGGSSSQASLSPHLAALAPGNHRIDADCVLGDGSVVAIGASFHIAEATPLPPAPIPVPTPAPVPTPVPTPAPVPMDDFEFLVSDSANRINPVPLSGATLSDQAAYIFLSVDPPAIQVRFFVDNPERGGQPDQTENYTPYDLAGGSVARGNRLLPLSLGRGAHRVDAEISLANGTVEVETVFFSVAP